METFRFLIADIFIRIDLESHVSISDNFLPFAVHGDRPDQEYYRFTSVDELPAPAGPLVWQHCKSDSRLRDGTPCVFRQLAQGCPAYLAEVCPNAHEHLLYILRSSNQIPETMYSVFNEIALEDLLLHRGALLLHSSLICWNGKAILFSAPSGTGKSTQADLWAKYMGADILNGDRSANRKINGIWTAYGLPVAGSSDIFRNESAPIRCIVMLDQASENRIVRLSPAQALLRIYPEFTLHRWDEEFLNRGLNLILDLLESVPVYALSCRPDQGAVELLSQTIQHDEVHTL